MVHPEMVDVPYMSLVGNLVMQAMIVILRQRGGGPGLCL